MAPQVTQRCRLISGSRSPLCGAAITTTAPPSHQEIREQTLSTLALDHPWKAAVAAADGRRPGQLARNLPGYRSSMRWSAKPDRELPICASRRPGSRNRRTTWWSGTRRETSHLHVRHRRREGSGGGSRYRVQRCRVSSPRRPGSSTSGAASATHAMRRRRRLCPHRPTSNSRASPSPRVSRRDAATSRTPTPLSAAVGRFEWSPSRHAAFGLSGYHGAYNVYRARRTGRGSSAATSRWASLDLRRRPGRSRGAASARWSRSTCRRRWRDCSPRARRGLSSGGRGRSAHDWIAGMPDSWFTVGGARRRGRLRSRPGRATRCAAFRSASTSVRCRRP